MKAILKFNGMYGVQEIMDIRPYFYIAFCGKLNAVAFTAQPSYAPNTHCHKLKFEYKCRNAWGTPVYEMTDIE